MDRHEAAVAAIRSHVALSDAKVAEMKRIEADLRAEGSPSVAHVVSFQIAYYEAHGRFDTESMLPDGVGILADALVDVLVPE